MKKILAIVGPMLITAAAGWLAKRHQNKDQSFTDTATPARS